MNPKILVVDDEKGMCELLATDLGMRGFEVSWHTSAKAGFDEILLTAPDVVLTDLRMPGFDGIEFCRRIVENRPDVPVVVMTAFGSMETAVAAIRAGAYDFVTKPIEMDVLALTLDRAVRHRQLSDQVKVLSEEVARTERFEELLGATPAMQKLFDLIARVAELDSSVLITGESGTGKELVARSLHRRSPRGRAPFVAVNCAAFPDTLLESELFGHVKGAFTDARGDRKGLFVQAEGGTLFLDEIGEMPITMQPKLLRAIEERKIRPVGSEKETPFDVRIIAATNRDLETEVEEGRFREDLFFRINVIQIEVPPLRMRGNDTLLLAQHFVEHFAVKSGKPVRGISEAVAQKILGYAWPGNVRELRNVIERAVALTRFDELAVEDLPKKIRQDRGSHVVVGGDEAEQLVSLDEISRRYILHVLDSVAGNKTTAAKTLGIDRNTLYRRLKQYGIED
ncbi:MAG: sigma-54-dependent Fis family transcriptional regulator [Planctomycetales bacterium]|nr:sigma-54-dependent Fis family transcriptional regulator [Planctomycetales bacterium]